MLLNLYFHHHAPLRGVFHGPLRPWPKVERKKENDEALLLALGML